MYLSKHSLVIVALLLQTGMTGCVVVPPDKYANTKDNIDVDPKDRRTIKVEANKPWQKPGIYLVRGAKVHIRARGSWSPWPEIGMKCGPEGEESAAFSGEAPWIPVCALMARLGTDGRPFLIGQEIEFTAQDAGHLYLAMNDPFVYLSNNSGALSVSVSIEYPEQPKP